jgi:CBS domain-containing protein
LILATRRGNTRLSAPPRRGGILSHKIRDFGPRPATLKPRPPPIEHAKEIMLIAKSPVITVAPTTPVYDSIKIMCDKGFRRLPVVEPGTRKIHGMLVAMDIVDYLGGGSKYNIVKEKYSGDFFKAIYEPVKWIMTKDVVSAPNTSRVSDVIKLLAESKVGGLPIVDKENKVGAIVTERDIVFMVANKMSGIPVSKLMTKKVVGIDSNTSIKEAGQRMVSHGFRRLPLISHNQIKGIVTAMDIIRFFCSKDVFSHLGAGTIDSVLKTKVDEISTHDLITIKPSADIGEATEIMKNKGVGALLVVKGKLLQGIITERDLFKIFQP